MQTILIIEVVIYHIRVSIVMVHFILGEIEKHPRLVDTVRYDVTMIF